MKDEMQRLLDPGSDLTDEERRLLGADAEFGPRAAERHAMWAALTPQLPPGGGAPANAPAAGKVVSLVAVKAVVGIAAGALLWFGGRALMPDETPRAVPSGVESPRVAVAPSEQSAARETAPTFDAVPAPPRQSSKKAAASVPARNVATPAASARATAAATPAAPASAAPSEAASRLKAEEEALDRARSALRQGDPARAQQLLDQASTQFSGGMLVQEREALAIETLWTGGKRDEARERAHRFLGRFPTSPLAARVRTYAK